MQTLDAKQVAQKDVLAKKLHLNAQIHALTWIAQMHPKQQMSLKKKVMMMIIMVKIWNF